MWINGKYFNIHPMDLHDLPNDRIDPSKLSPEEKEQLFKAIPFMEKELRDRWDCLQDEALQRFLSEFNEDYRFICDFKYFNELARNEISDFCKQGESHIEAEIDYSCFDPHADRMADLPF